MKKMAVKVLQLKFMKENLLIAHDLWQLNYQMLVIISQQKFTKLNIQIVAVFLYLKVSRII